MLIEKVKRYQIWEHGEVRSKELLQYFCETWKMHIIFVFIPPLELDNFRRSHIIFLQTDNMCKLAPFDTARIQTLHLIFQTDILKSD